MNEIKQIRTVTLSKDNPVSLNYDMAIDFLSDGLINKQDGHYHYISKNINLLGRTLILFKYNAELIAKGIFSEEVSKKVFLDGIEYNGYFVTEKDSIEIFKSPINLETLNEYVPNIKSLTRDQIIDLEYLHNVNKMIQDYSSNESNNTITDQYDSPAKIIRNYLNKNNLADFKQENKENNYLKFRNEFSPEILEKLEGLELINKIFLHDGDKSTLCYTLEFVKEYSGGIGGGSAYKYSLFKSNKTQQWTAGSSRNHQNFADNEAIEIGTKIRDAIVNGAKHIENTKLNSIEDYLNLEKELNNIFEDCLANPDNSWIHKYYNLIFPDKFPDVHSNTMKKDLIRRFHLEPHNSYYANDYQLYELSKKAGIKFYSLLNDEILQLFPEDEILKTTTPTEIKKVFTSHIKRNIIYFGAPGTGKSYNLNQDKEDLLENYTNNYERVTFHPDYSYANFVGTYKPVPDDDSITYKYVPGPFMRILKKALEKPSEPFLLIIEEINRANVAAVFGDVFQLLDRENNESLYSIDATEDMKSYLNQDKIKIPQNMFIWATMNSADQGVFPMDTAFKRRWDFNYFNIDTGEYKIENTYVNLNNQKISWNKLRKEINKELLSYKINEDKLLGPFFAFNEYLNEEIPENEFKEIFKNKIIMYLFEDAARSRRNNLFQGAQGDNNYVTYSQICELFDEKGIEIFCDNIKSKFSQEEEE